MSRRPVPGGITRAVLAIAVMLFVPMLGAQVPDTAAARPDTRLLPADVAREVVALYNAPAALRSTGPATIDVGQIVEGDVAVLTGPLRIRGEVRGRVVVVNGNLLLAQGSRVDGDIVVVGGTISGMETAEVGGQLRWHPQQLRFVRDGDRIALAEEPRDLGEIIDWRPWPRRDDPWRSRILVTSGGTYNRVEGLPILIGPSIRLRSDMTRLSVDVLGIIRSADGFRWTRENLGYDADARLRVGDDRGLSAGVLLYDEVRPVEAWQLRNIEAALATFFVRRDYRDYYNRHGTGVLLGLHAGRTADLELAFRREHWRGREQRDPFSLFRQGAEWRINPAMDEGRFNITSLRLTADSRNEPERPRTGWLISAELEHGSSGAAWLAEGHDIASELSPGADRVQPLSYSRAFLDLRRYNRVSPHGQLNLRLVIGGWIGGDDLPMQRRLSLGGTGTLPGYNFRRPAGEDVFTCGGGLVPGTPALCERVALVQVEYRGDLRLQWGRGGAWAFEIDRPAAWVLFANSGRGWLVGTSSPVGRAFSASDLPPLGSFRTDVGGGLDLGWLGLFVAKSVTDADEAANFFIRLRQRF